MMKHNNYYVRTLGAVSIGVFVFSNALEGDSAPEWAGDAARVLEATVSSTATTVSGGTSEFVRNEITGEEYQLLPPSSVRYVTSFQVVE